MWLYIYNKKHYHRTFENPRFWHPNLISVLFILLGRLLLNHLKFDVMWKYESYHFIPQIQMIILIWSPHTQNIPYFNRILFYHQKKPSSNSTASTLTSCAGCSAWGGASSTSSKVHISATISWKTASSSCPSRISPSCTDQCLDKSLGTKGILGNTLGQ